MAFWEYGILFISVLAGGALAFPFRKGSQPALRLLLSFSGAYLLGITMVHLMPGAFSTGSSKPGLWIMCGFFVQLILEQLSRGVEHGHVHVHEKGRSSFAIQVMIGLSLHAFLEGLPLSHYGTFHESLHGHQHGHHHLLFGIVLHKLPAAFALVSLFLLSHIRKGWALACLILFSAMSPLGAFSASFVTLSQDAIANLLGFVIGSFLHIATTILFEADDNHQHHVSWAKLGAIVLGVGLALASNMF